MNTFRRMQRSEYETEKYSKFLWKLNLGQSGSNYMIIILNKKMYMYYKCNAHNYWNGLACKLGRTYLKRAGEPCDMQHTTLSSFYRPRLWNRSRVYWELDNLFRLLWYLTHLEIRDPRWIHLRWMSDAKLFRTENMSFWVSFSKYNTAGALNCNLWLVAVMHPLGVAATIVKGL